MKLSISNKLQFFTGNTNLLYYEAGVWYTECPGLSLNYTLNKRMLSNNLLPNKLFHTKLYLQCRVIYVYC